jgi:hypothetical protein
MSGKIPTASQCLGISHRRETKTSPLRAEVNCIQSGVDARVSYEKSVDHVVSQAMHYDFSSPSAHVSLLFSELVFRLRRGL